MNNGTKHMKENGWTYTVYPFSQTVMMAEHRIRWYDEKRLERIRTELREKGCKCCWAKAAVNSSKITKNAVYVEVYKLFSEGKTFEEKQEVLRGILEGINWEKEKAAV